MTDSVQLSLFYSALLHNFGHQNWWPSDSDFETVIGAILAQNVSWNGAYNAITNIKKDGLLHPHPLSQADVKTIAPLIRSSRYYNQKAEKIVLFMEFFIDRFKGSMTVMAAEDLSLLRSELLALKGFGPETVDSILLYACHKPVFVVDAYTRRVGSRQGWYNETISYQQMQEFFTARLPEDVLLYNDFHAQIVRLCSTICKTSPGCDICPVRNISERICQFAARSDISEAL